MRQLGHAPGAGHPPHELVGLPRRRKLEAGQLVLAEAREVGHVGAVVGRQARGPHALDESEPAVVLHGSRLGGVRLGVG